MASYIQHLEDLKDKYQDGIVSLLIGTGFSRNAYKDMPLWDGLLLDMARKQFNSSKTDEELEGIIRQAPTAIVDSFLKTHKRDELDNYIEHHIPFIDNNLRVLFAPMSGYDPIQKSTIIDDDLYLHYQLLNGSWLNIYTTNYDNLLELASKRRGYNYKLITHRNELAETIHNRKIIKLHGSIINPHSDDYSPSFDGQEGVRYIISKSDYDDYEKHHDAFCNIIKGNLLQGSFCLIGFSGTDPNFITWKNWLRNIIDATLLNQAKEKTCPSIYIIDISKEEIDHAYLKNLHNHYIHVIQLLNPEVKARIKFDGNEKDYKAMLSHFLSYIYKNEQSTTSYLKPQGYQDLWRHSIIWGQPMATVNYSVLPQILQQKKDNRIVKNAYWQEELLDRIYTKDPLTKDDIDYILCALQDTMFVPGQYKGLNDRFQKAALTKEQDSIYHQLNNREVTLFNPIGTITTTDDATTYESILRHLFLLELDDAANLLEKWDPTGLYIIKKAFFSSLFGLSVDLNRIKTLITSLDKREVLWATNCLNIIDFYEPLKYDTAEYDSQGLSSLYEVCRSILNACIEKKNEIEPYGSTRDKVFWIGKSDSDYRHSFRFLQFLIDMPYSTQLGIFSFIESGKWYQVFKPLFEKTPYPIVFYSLLYRDKKVSKRMGQDIAYSQCLYNNGVTEDLLVRMLKALNQDRITPQIAEGIFHLGSQLFISVNPNKWQTLFYQFWQKHVSKDLTILESPSGISVFIHQAVSLLSDKEIVCCILCDCLSRTVEQKELRFAIDVLYHLRKIRIDSTEIEKDVNRFIDRIRDVKEFVVITNVHYYLSESQAKRISEKILPIITNKQLPTIVIRPLCYYAQFNPQILAEVKQCILQSQYLWDNGLHGEYSTTSETIKLSHFKNIIEWDLSELIIIYNRLKESFYELISNKFYQIKGGVYIVGSYDKLFDEMYDFLETNKNLLSTIDEYKRTKHDVKKELNTTRGFEDIEIALSSEDASTFKWGLRELLKAYRMGKTKKGEVLLLVLLDRILLQNQVSLRSSLDFASYILKNYYTTRSLSKSALIRRKYLQILALYNEELLQDINQEIPFTGRYLADIAITLEKMQCKSKHISRWKTFLSSGRYIITFDEDT